MMFAAIFWCFFSVIFALDWFMDEDISPEELRAIIASLGVCYTLSVIMSRLMWRAVRLLYVIVIFVVYIVLFTSYR